MKVLINSAELQKELLGRSRSFNRLVIDKFAGNSRGETIIDFLKDDTRLGQLHCMFDGLELDWKFKGRSSANDFFKLIQSIPVQPLEIEFGDNVAVKAYHVFT